MMAMMPKDDGYFNKDIKQCLYVYRVVKIGNQVDYSVQNDHTDAKWKMTPMQIE